MQNIQVNENFTEKQDILFKMETTEMNLVNMG